jgi:hypothetical protein
MADQIGPSRVSTRRISRTTKSTTKRTGRAGGKSVRVDGLKQVDTIPRLEPQDFEDGESKGLARLLGEEGDEGFTHGSFAEDLARTLAFVEALPPEPLSGKQSDLHQECARILQDEVARAREMAALRKAVPRA